MDIPKFNQLIEPLIKIRRLGPSNSGSGEYANANPKIIVLHPRRPCDDCEDMVEGRAISYIIKDGHWVKKCDYCNHKSRVSHPLKS